jgi:hypothetical protein
MANIPQKVSERLVAGIKKFKPVLMTAHENKANESNTVIIITAILSEIFGYDTFQEITSEVATRTVAGKDALARSFIENISPCKSQGPVAHSTCWVLLVGLIWFAQPNIKPRLGRGFAFETHPILPAQTPQVRSRLETDFAPRLEGGGFLSSEAAASRRSGS